VISPAKPPYIPPEFRTTFEKWRPVYKHFRFSEAIQFPEVEKIMNSSDESHKYRPMDMSKIQLNSAQTNIIQCLAEYAEVCFFRIIVLEIDDECELQVGAALPEVTLQRRDLRQKDTMAFFLSKKTPRSFPISDGKVVLVMLKCLIHIHLVIQCHVEPPELWHFNQTYLTHIHLFL